jgi:ABC-type antimicrobial peptide transport system permease subunit
VDPNLPIFGVKTLAGQIDESIFTDRLVAALSVMFGVLATVLAAVGLYGVMAYMVIGRTREIGIRVALGADRGRVLRLVLREAALLAGGGIAVALLASVAVGRLIGSQLFGVTGHDPMVLAVATAVLVVVALFASYVPALRATKVNPLVALRWE